MKTLLITLLLGLIPFSTKATQNTEIWAYLYKGEEKHFPVNSPITDVACFSTKVDENGHLKGGHSTPPNLKGTTSDTRYHLVVTIPWNTTLAHIYLNPDLPFRNRIIVDIAERSAPFDGVQIDFESISPADGTAYLNFLSAVKNALSPEKCFSVAVMARWKSHKEKNPKDAFDYPFISMIADRVIVMAYDEHYGGGSAGPIASLPWCEKIFAYARETIPAEKLVMGIPLYGRSWQTEKVTQAFRNREVWTNIRIHKPLLESNAADGGSYSYTTNVTIKVHFESMPSLDAKMDMYNPARGIAFWRIGQEPINFWNHISK